MPGIPVLEIFFLVASMTVFSETGKRRGTNPWPFTVVALVGFFVLPSLSVYFVGGGTALFVKAGWLALVYGSLFVLGGRGRRLADTWQCPTCMLFNPPTTLVCPCGQVAEGVDPSAARPRTPDLLLGVWPQITDAYSAAWAARQGLLACGLKLVVALVNGAIALSAGNTEYLYDVAAAVIIYVPMGVAFSSTRVWRQFWGWSFTASVRSFSLSKWAFSLVFYHSSWSSCSSVLFVERLPFIGTPPRRPSQPKAMPSGSLRRTLIRVNNIACRPKAAASNGFAKSAQAPNY